MRRRPGRIRRFITWLGDVALAAIGFIVDVIAEALSDW